MPLVLLVTGADYLPPPKGVPYLSPQKELKSRYRYLDSDGALLRTPVWPLPSETKVCFYCACIFLSKPEFKSYFVLTYNTANLYVKGNNV